eukprot:6598710-Prymnesium_polylepis.1
MGAQVRQSTLPDNQLWSSNNGCTGAMTFHVVVLLPSHAAVLPCPTLHRARLCGRPTLQAPSSIPLRITTGFWPGYPLRGRAPPCAVERRGGQDDRHARPRRQRGRARLGACRNTEGGIEGWHARGAAGLQAALPHEVAQAARGGPQWARPRVPLGKGELPRCDEAEEAWLDRAGACLQ